MRRIRIYQAIPLKEGESITLDTQASQHILRVLRLQMGDPLTIFNGSVEHHAQLAGTSGKNAVLLLTAQCGTAHPSALTLHVGFPATRNEVMDLIVQKGTELGVQAFTPIDTLHSSVKRSKERMEKRLASLAQVILSSCEQCGRIDVPILHPTCTLSDFLATTKTASSTATSIGQTPTLQPLSRAITTSHTSQQSTCFILDPNSPLSLHQFLQQNPPTPEVTLLSGPEGGFHIDEIALAKDQGAIPVQLGPRILRAETAPIVALALLQSVWNHDQ